MGDYTACLIDVYDTVLSCNLSAHGVEVPGLVGVDNQAWDAAFRDLFPAVMDGRLSMSDAYAEVMRRSGVEPSEDQVRAMVERDGELLRENSRVHTDTVPFLETLRRKGIATAFVSNCAANTGPLLSEFGLSELVDVVVLSCDVGAAKPDPAIYEHALRELGVSARDALFVDDQVSYCDGASALGISAVRIRRGGVSLPSGGPAEVTSLAELDSLF